ncbi:hypothetical protein LOTGIDRAFT_165215 [Lottia gigantea]|uniref:Uncharacterized protein n=1 Tax=Lottia gigantea TaxID=225164 RepID=V4BJ55_LOTGI|nr:hypothetical protein LOTGIDRAFT_165215 [Lottia gigantea]ESO88799.1 hypothetical protein LOTGIDRAFT_165215 [Lottia gigantea]
MSMKVNPPVLSNDKTYERYKQELLARHEITNLEKGKQGIAVALFLIEQEKLRIRERFFDELTTDQLKAEDGLTVLITFLDKHLGKDELVDSLEDFKRKETQSITEYISDFDSKYSKIVKKNMTLLPEILAFKLLKCANISKDERMLVLTGMNYERKDTLYEQAKVSLKKFKGSASGGKDSLENSSDLKLEPTFLAENEEVLAAAGYYKFNSNRGNGGQYHRGNSNYSFRPNRGRSSGSNLRGRGYDRSEKHMNPKSFNGKTLTCHACGSYRHLLKDCSHSYENRNAHGDSKEAFISDNEVLLTMNNFENVIMYTGYDKQDVSHLGKESQHSAVIDTACSSTVSGMHWYETFLSTFPENKQKEIKEFKGTKWFKFGNACSL